MKKNAAEQPAKWVITANVEGGTCLGEIAAKTGKDAIEKIECRDIELCAKCAKRVECLRVVPKSMVATKVGGDGEVYRVDGPPTSSPAFRFLQHLWSNSQEATGHSWTRLNGAMYEGVNLAIKAGLFFDANDFERIHKSFRGEYWFGEQNGEGWYSTAIKYANDSACQAIEHWHRRKPIIFDGQRISVGTQVWWPERGIHGGAVTSFKDDKESVVICTYAIDPETKERSATPTKRITVHRNDFVEREKARKGKASLDNDMRSIQQCLLRIAGSRHLPTEVTEEMLSTIKGYPASKRKRIREWCSDYWSTPMPDILKQLLPESAQQVLAQRAASEAA